jgi:ribosome assembly protein YihI (activator of Der GTPase)
MSNIKVIDGVEIPLTEEEEEKLEVKRKAWTDGKAVRDAMAEIQKLESQETPRRLAEALPDDAGGSADGRAWLKANRDKIILERAKL